MSVTLARLGEVFVITWRLKDQSSGEGFLEAPELRHAYPPGVYGFLRSRSGKTEDEALVNEIAQRPRLLRGKPDLLRNPCWNGGNAGASAPPEVRGEVL